MLPEWTQYAISLIFFFTVDALEVMSTVNIFRSFKSWRVNLKVRFAAPCHITIMIKFV